jgi:solute:Na+ symporter, SSS family
MARLSCQQEIAHASGRIFKMSVMFWPVVIFMIISLAIGLYTFTKVRGSSQQYTVCGKSMPFIVVGTALAAQSIDGNATLGNTSLTFSSGVWTGLAIPLGLALSLFVVGRFLAAPLNRMNLLTLPEFFFRRYGATAELLASFLTIVCFIVLVAGNLAAVAWILSSVAGISYVSALAVGTTVILIYTVAGGLHAAIWTDFFQIHVAIVGFLAAAAITLINFPVDLSKFSDLSGLTKAGSGAIGNWASIISLGFGNAMALDFMERVFSAKTPDTAKRACYYAGVWTIIIGFCASVMGIASLQLMPSGSDPRMVLPMLATSHLPYLVGVMVFVGVLGASMSTANGAMLVISVVMARNIWQRHTKHSVTDAKLLFWSRALALPTALAAGLIAYWRPEPGLLLVVAFDIVFAGCVVPLFAGVYGKKATAAGAIGSIVAGTVARGIAYFVVPPEWAGLDTLLPPLVSALAFFAICQMKREEVDERRFDRLYQPAKEEMLEVA